MYVKYETILLVTVGLANIHVSNDLLKDVTTITRWVRQSLKSIKLDNFKT